MAIPRLIFERLNSVFPLRRTSILYRSANGTVGLCALAPRYHSSAVPNRSGKLAGARRGSAERPYSRQPAYKPGSGQHANGFACVTAIPLGRRLPGVAAGAVRSYRTISPLPWSAEAPRRYVFCGTVPRFAPAGCYPAPFVRGARTFLSDNLSVSPERPSDRLTPSGMGILRESVKGRSRTIAPQA